MTTLVSGSALRRAGALSSFAAGLLFNLQAIAQEPPWVAEDGTLHTPGLTIPPSDLWSAEFGKFYAKAALEKFRKPFYSVPAKDAPPAEWDAFFAWNEQEIAEPLAWNLAHYPVDIQETRLAGVPVAVVTPKGGVAPRNAKRVLINLRGGGFIFNHGLTWGKLESIPVASLGGFKVITVDYRQAPKYRHPAATEDVELIYKELLEQYRPGAIGIYGCSAGGFLTAQVAARLQKSALPRPGAIGILCAAAGSFERLGDSKLWGPGIVPGMQFTPQMLQAAKPGRWYMEGTDLRDPLAYPASSDDVLAKFPPTLLLVGTRELAMSAAIATNTRLLRLGVDSTIYMMEGAPHASHVLAVGTPEAKDANAYIATWFDRHLSR